MKKLASVLFASLLLSTAVWAYIPPATFMIKTIASKHGGVKGVRFRGTVHEYRGEVPSGVYFKVTTVLKDETGVLRSWASDDSGKQLYVIERRLGAGVNPLATPANAIGQLLLDANFTRIEESLKKEGIDISATPSEHLARWNKSFAWVIGKGKQAKNEPQLWIEKDTFYPVRLVPAVPGAELQFENFRHFHDFPFPRAISQIQDKQLLLKVEFRDLAKNPTSDLTAFKHPVTPGFTEAGNAAPESVKRLIQQFFEGAPR